MSISFENKKTMISGYQLHGKDTGSADVQIALLTERIKYLTGHFKIHKKDNHSRRGLLILVSRRKRILNYLKRTDYPRYSQLIQKLDLRK